MEEFRFRLPDETTGTEQVIDLGVWTNIPDEVDIPPEVFRKLRDMPSEFPDLPCEEDEDL